MPSVVFPFGPEIHTIVCDTLEEAQQILHRFDLPGESGQVMVPGDHRFYFLPADHPRMLLFEEGDAFWQKVVAVFGKRDFQAEFDGIVDHLEGETGGE